MESSMLVLSDEVLLNLWEKGTHPRRYLFVNKSLNSGNELQTRIPHWRVITRVSPTVWSQPPSLSPIKLSLEIASKHILQYRWPNNIFFTIHCQQRNQQRRIGTSSLQLTPLTRASFNHLYPDFIHDRDAGFFLHWLNRQGGQLPLIFSAPRPPRLRHVTKMTIRWLGGCWQRTSVLDILKVFFR